MLRGGVDTAFRDGEGALASPLFGSFNENGERINDTPISQYLQDGQIIKTRSIFEQLTPGERMDVQRDASEFFNRYYPTDFTAQDSARMVRILDQAFGDEETLRAVVQYPNVQDIVNGVDRQSISPKNASRIIKAVDTGIKKMPEGLTPAQRQAVITLTEILGGLAALRSQMYDMSVLNPDGQFQGSMGRRFAPIHNEIMDRSREVLNAINAIVGEPTSPNRRQTPPEGTYGHTLYTGITAGMGIMAANSANKLAREATEKGLLPRFHEFIRDNLRPDDNFFE